MREHIIALLLLATISNEVVIDKAEAQKAFLLINKIRQSPEKYYQELNFDKSFTVNSTSLKWNDTLARVAEQKAFDMARRDYFSHTDPDGFGINYFIAKSGYRLAKDWITNKAANFFESISAEVEDGESAVKNLVIDKGVPSLGHRRHLLGNGIWESTLTDIGIGFARRDSGSTYQTYVSIIIAKHP
ncbi:MAG: CAP domain-containing protein [Chitinophagaceae bacterium]